MASRLGPLAGLTVVELGWGTPGSITAMLFADYGARVLKIEKPGGGPESGSVAHAAWDRGKWSIECDLRTEEGADAVAAILGRADVVIDSLGRGKAERFGLGYAAIHQRWPHLVYTSITGYPVDSPWANRPAFDQLVAAHLGQMSEQPGPRDGPKFLGHPSVSYGTAFVAMISTLAALHVHHQTGRGQQVDTSLLDGVLAQSCMNWWWSESGASYLARSGTEQGFGRGRLVTDLFQCSDGEWVMVHTGGSGGFKTAMDLLGFGDRVRKIDGLEMSVPLDDDELHIARDLVPQVMLTRPRSEWVSLFHAADLAALPVLKPGEILNDEQVDFAGVAIELDDPSVGRVKMAGPVIDFSVSPPPTPKPAPRVGRDNARLAELLDEPTRTLDASCEPSGVGDGRLRAPLEGLKVLDFSAFFATAYGAKFLSDLGADVIKVEALEGDQMRPLPDPFEACQRGKRTIAVDLKSAEGRAIVAELVKTADIVFHNLRPGKAEKIGIGYEELRAIKSDLIYCYLPGFGSKGPKSGLKSFAPLLSGFTGLLWESSGVEAERPVRRAMGNEDYNNGFVGAIAALMALHHRNKTGEGQRIESPQLHSSLLVTTEQCLGPDGQLLSGRSIDSEQKGWNSLYRLYETSDGAVCIAVVSDSSLRRLGDTLDLSLPSGLTYQLAISDSTDEVIKIISERIKQLSSEETFQLLDGAGIACEIPLDHPHMPDLLWEEWALDSNRVLEHYHPVHGLIREVGFVTRLSDNPCVAKGPAPLLGQHTVEILTELGRDDDSIRALIGSGICIQSENS